MYLVDGVTFESNGGAALVDRVHERGGRILIVATGHPRVNSTSCSTACADGVVSAAGDLSALVSAVRCAASADCDAPDGSDESTATEAQLARELLASLSPRERVVLDRIMTGMSAPQIAEAEFVAVPTVRSQIRSILGKLCVNSQLAAVAIAHRAGWNASIPHNHQI